MLLYQFFVLVVLQELVIDIGLSCELLNDVLKHPYLEKHRTVFIEHITSEWIGMYPLLYNVHIIYVTCTVPKIPYNYGDGEYLSDRKCLYLAQIIRFAKFSFFIFFVGIANDKNFPCTT